MSKFILFHGILYDESYPWNFLVGVFNTLDEAQAKAAAEFGMIGLSSEYYQIIQINDDSTNELVEARYA